VGPEGTACREGGGEAEAGGELGRRRPGGGRMWGGGGRAIGGSFKITAVNSLESSETAGEGKKATHWTSKIFTGTYTRYSNQNIHSSNIIFTRCFSFICCFNVPAI
jgi:hypothetical protein